MKIKMKKTLIALFAVIIGLVPFSTANASESKALVIIDSYFDSTKVPAGSEIVCVVSDNCIYQAKATKSMSDGSNHGTAMAEIAVKNNPDVKLILIRTAAVSKAGTVSTINGQTFLNALNWVNNNSSRVSAVSFSYNLSGNMKAGECKLSTTGAVNVSVVDPQIRSAISSLNNLSIPVFAATGNTGKIVNYPACITDTVSVSTYYRGTVYNNNYDANTDVFGNLTPMVGVGANYRSAIFNLVPHTTSGATVAVASKYVASGSIQKVVEVLP